MMKTKEERKWQLIQSRKSSGNKYSVMSEVVKEILFSGPYESPEDKQTAIEMAYVKHTILVLREIEKNGDSMQMI